MAVAVFKGIIVRQIGLFGNALVVMGQNLIAFISSFTGLSGAEAINTTAVQANTVALATQAEAMAVANLQRAKSVTGTTAHSTATAINTAEVALNAAQNAKRNATVLAGGVTMGRVSKILSVASRGLLAFAGPIGIVVAGLSLIPLAF